MTSVIHVIIIIIITTTSFSRLVSTSGAALCAPSCTCQKNPRSFLVMDCSSVINFPFADLKIVSSSALVTDLDLSNNSLTSLPALLFHSFVRLETLTLRWNRLAVVESGAFDGSQLRRLDLSGNRLAAIRPRTFSDVESTIVELDLSSNVIVTIDEAFVGLSALSRLDLRHNLLASLSATSLRGLSSLRHLRLDNNLIAEVDALSLSDLSKLTNLALRGNPLTALTRLNFPGNVSLSYVDLSECSLTTVPRGVPDTVTYVQLRRNNITRINGDSFFGASRVKILVLDENQISQVDVDDRSFRQLRNLKQLWLNINRLVRVPVGLPSSIERLMLDSNNIEKLSADSFPNLSQLSTLTLMENAITEVAIGSFRSLSTLTHLDLSANKITSLSSGLFESNTQLKTLLLSRNPLQIIDAGSFHGITQLRTLSLSFVQTRICVDEDAFAPLSRLISLQLDNSPWLAATFVSSSRFVTSLTSLRHLSLQRTDLSRLKSSFLPTFFPNVESVRLSGSGWACDEDLKWLRDWLSTSSLVNELDRQLNRCAEPPPVATRLVVSLADHEFKQAVDRKSPHHRTQPRTENSKLLRDDADKDCNKRSRTTSSVAMATGTGTPTKAFSSLSGLMLRGQETTSTSSVTSHLRHGDVIDDVGLVQVMLIVCTLVVTLILSAIIIGVIVRLTGRHHHDHDVISGIKSPDHVTGSRISVRHCPPEDMAVEGWRSRASSLSRSSRGGGGRTADYQRQTGGKKLVCDDVNDRLVSTVDVDRLFTNGGGTRLTDEQWRMYTWEDT